MKVVHLPVEPILNEDIEPALVLDDAKAANLVRVVVCGIDADGMFMTWASPASNGDSLMLVERAKGQIIEAEREGGWRPQEGGEVVRFPGTPE